MGHKPWSEIKHKKHENGMSPVHPGEVLFQEFILPSTLTVAELADKMGVSELFVLKLITENQDVDKNTSEKLFAATGSSSEFWMNLQRSYDNRLNATGTSSSNKLA